MDSKIFLAKYRVSAEEIEEVGELTDSPVAYEGEEIDSGKKVIVEVVPAGSLKPAVRERLEAEAVAAKKLNHVNIPTLYDFGVEDDHLVYVTEDFEGTLAEEWVNARGPMPVGPVLRIASQVVSALGAAAFHRINHHAINPSNLVLAPGQTAEGEWPLVRVLHFVGVLPKFSGTDVDVAGFDKSLHYASPEQIKMGTVDFRSELYSLGCTMWFLLTGAPPLTAPKGSAAVQPAQTKPIEEKMSAVPKKIRHLLAQMLSENPEARPRDPLAFYRKLQDCLAQVEQRETVAPKSRAPAFSPTLADRTQRPRRNPLKALARAAIFLALAALAALVLRGYLQHRRVVRDEEPIGVPIGVAEAKASATPAGISAANAIASNTVPATTVAPNLNNTEPAPATNADSDKSNAQTLAANSVASASTNQVAAAPAPPPADAPSTPRAQAPASITANNASTPPAANNSSKVAVAAQMELPSATARAHTVETSAVAPQTSPKKIIMREVRRAELIEEPEVRRAEPAPPEEGPVDVALETRPSSTQPSKSVTRTKKSRDVKRTDSQPQLSATPGETKKEPTPRPKRQANEKIYLPVQAR
jgi:serine/threonine protein kinase